MEMKIASGDVSMLNAGASQGEDNQQLLRDASNSQNLDPLSVLPK